MERRNDGQVGVLCVVEAIENQRFRAQGSGAFYGFRDGSPGIEEEPLGGLRQRR
jgi:hypothetical protein